MNLSKNILSALDIIYDADLISYKGYKEVKSKNYSDEDIDVLEDLADILLHANSFKELSQAYRDFIKIL